MEFLVLPVIHSAPLDFYDIYNGLILLGKTERAKCLFKYVSVVDVDKDHPYVEIEIFDIGSEKVRMNNFFCRSKKILANKIYSTNTLNSWTKKELINHIRLLEHNWNSTLETFNIQSENVEMILNQQGKELIKEFTETLKDKYLPIIGAYMDDDEAKVCNRSLCEMTNEICNEFVDYKERSLYGNIKNKTLEKK